MELWLTLRIIGEKFVRGGYVDKSARSAQGRLREMPQKSAAGLPSHRASGPVYSRSRGRRGALAWLPLLLVLAGVAVMSYPYVSNWFAERNASRAIQNYGEAVARYSLEELEAARTAALEYNESLAGDPVHDPFVPGSGYALPKNYEEVLNLDGDGVMGFIEIPKIDVSLPILHGTSEDVLAEGVGHIEQTALPVGGEGRHSVLTGHRGLPSAELFTRLDELEVGDEFYIHVLDDVMAYRVDDNNVVEPDQLAELAAEPGLDLVTLVTCTPYAVNTHRLLVRGSRVSYAEGAEEKAAANSAGWRPTPYELGLAAGAGLLAVMGAGTLALRRRGPRGRHARR